MTDRATMHFVDNASEVNATENVTPVGTGSASKRGRGSYARRGRPHVAADAVSDHGFSFERAAAGQCVDHKAYSVAASCPEREHFTQYALRVLQAVSAHGPGPRNNILDAVVDTVAEDCDKEVSTDALLLHHVYMGQLSKVAEPRISERESPKNTADYTPDEYETYSATSPAGKAEWFVQAPVSEGGCHYKVRDMNYVKNHIRFVFTVRPSGFDLDADGDAAEGMIDYALLFSLKQKSTTENNVRSRPEHVQITSGELNPVTLEFSAWKNARVTQCVQVIDTPDVPFIRPMFYPAVWPSVPSPVNDHDYNMSYLEQRTARLRYVFETIDYCIAVQQSVRGQEPEWIKLANFCVVSMLDTFMFVDGAHMPYHKLLCRHLLDPEGEGTVYLSAEGDIRTPKTEGFRFLDVEVLVDVATLRDQSEVRGVFKKFHVNLDAGNLSADHMACVMISLPLPVPKSVIVRFGRQPDKVFVAGNCAFKDGLFLSHAEAGVAIVPQYFEEFNLSRKDYPRHIIIQYPHVRYAIGVNIWNKFMPAFFKNNLMSARASLAVAVMGLHASKFWKGQSGVGHGMPFAWIASREAGTGKTEAVSLAHSLLGFHRSALVSGDITKPAMFERLSLQSDLTVIIDDVVFGQQAQSGESRAYSQLGRAIFDRTSRAVMNKTRLPYSSAMFTSNQSVNDEDRAFQSRVLLLTFDPLTNESEAGDATPAMSANMYQDWLKMRELFSSLVVDFESILWHNKLDSEAIQDCAHFMQLAIGKHRDRNANMWGILLYYMLLINSLFQCSLSDQKAVFKWSIVSVTRAAHEFNNHSSILDQFIIAVAQVRADTGTVHANPLGSMEKTIFWHNLRTITRLNDFIAYTSVRVEPLCAVLKAVLNKTFKPLEVLNAVDKVTWASQGRAMFYDTSSNSWPIARCELDDVSQARIQIPLKEEELEPDTLKQMRCIHINQQMWDKIVDSVTNTSFSDVDYQSIVVKSAAGGPDYNFFNAVTGITDEAWFGYRALVHSTFSNFCGANAELNIGSAVTEIELVKSVCNANESMGFPGIFQLYAPDNLLHYFGYHVRNEADLPIGYTHNPFTQNYRDESFMASHIAPGHEDEREDDMQSVGNSGQQRVRENPGSTPLEDVTNVSKESTAPTTTTKKQRTSVDKEVSI